MRRTRIKVCGITRQADAETACAAGADALGFVFWPASPRAIGPDCASAIVRELPPFVTPVGVFVNQPVDEINAIVARVGLHAVQLHGDESIGVWTQVSVPVIKAVGVSCDMAPNLLAAWPRAVLPLLDAADFERRGGTGRTIDWRLAAAISRGRAVVLAGGLCPENVEEAVRLVRPFAVDVSSGVEESPGVKDAARIRAFAVGVLRADTYQES
ncbi:MAG: phosphoribosylanthranilate isomerase [Acidobacteriota bacterium]